MPIEFQKVVLLSDKESSGLATNTYTKLLKYAELEDQPIAGGIRDYTLSDLTIKITNNGEIIPRIGRTLRGRDVYVFVSAITDGVYNPNEPYIRAFTIADACKRANADKVTIIMPHMPYQRQDRRTTDKITGYYQREPITTRLILNLLHESGYKRIITIDPHFQQIEGFLPNEMQAEIPTARVALTSYLKQIIPSDEKISLVFSPDFGGGERAEIAARDIKAVFGGLCRKKRKEAGKIDSMTVLSEEGINLQQTDTAIIFDDLADSCGTLIKCSNAIKERGVKRVIAVAAHPVFSGNAIEKLNEANLEVVVTNTIPLSQTYEHIHVVDISTILAVTLHCVTTGHGSLSRDIFDPKKYQSLEGKLSK